MTKQDFLKLLEPLPDDAELAIDEKPFYYMPKITQICGKGQEYMIYKCVLPTGHDGPCYCRCKGIEFDPD